MSLHLLAIGEQGSGVNVGRAVALGYDDTTHEYGFLTRIFNGSDHNSVKGELVCSSPTYDNMYDIESTEFDAIGVVAESGIAFDAPVWVWKNGSRCQVLWKDGESATRGYVALCADTDGRGYNVAVPSANPVVAEHFKECGHVCESKSSGTDVLVLVDLHFN